MASNAHLYAINGYSYCQSRTAQEFLWHYSEQGFRYFEIILHPGHLWPSELDAAKRRELSGFLSRNDLCVLSLGVPALDWNLAGVAPETRAFSRHMVRSALELAGELGVPGVIASPGKTNPLQPAPKAQLLGWLYEALDELMPVAEKANTAILIENLPAAFLPDAGSLMEALEAYGDDRVGIVYDAANAAFIGEHIPDGLRRVKSRIRRVHISDTTRKAFRHAAVGEGDIDFAAVGMAMQEIGYGLPPILEIISQDPDSDISRSIRALSALGWDQAPPHRASDLSS